MSKETHIAVRTTKAAKTYTISRLKAINSPHTLSDVYNRLSAGMGLLSSDDAAIIAEFQKIIPRLRHAVLPSFPSDKSSSFKDENRYRRAFRNLMFPGKAQLLDALVNEATRLNMGCKPTYLFENSTDSFTFDIVDKALGTKDLTDKSEKWIYERCKEFEERCKEEKSLGLKDGRDMPAIYGAKYTIRAAWNDRPTTSGMVSYSDAMRPDMKHGSWLSEYVRIKLNYLDDVPSTTDGTYVFKFSSVKQQVEMVAEFLESFWDLKISRDYDDVIEAFGRYGKSLEECAKVIADLATEFPNKLVVIQNG